MKESIPQLKIIKLTETHEIKVESQAKDNIDKFVQIKVARQRVMPPM